MAALPDTAHTATAFLNLLKRLKIVLLQDVAAMMAQERTHLLFNHAIFQKTEFRDFGLAAKTHAEQAEEPVNAKLDTPVAPETTAPTSDTAMAAPAAPPLTYSIGDHNNMRSIWNQWNGVGKYAGGTHPTGGFKQLEKATKKTWRASFSSAETKRFSRMNYLVGVIDGKIAEGMAEFDAIEIVEAVWRDKKSLFPVHKHFKGQ
ncbi:hypothetical protein HDU78_010153 [Chytriomyces hyalinus]|nr:hypothetical protein HDU78_010153 [Chytriomyces hyalinus]